MACDISRSWARHPGRSTVVAASIATICVAAHARRAATQTLTPRTVVEFPFDEPVFYFPVDLLCRGDSLRAVVNRGDGTIVELTETWDVVRRFGRLGEGPGELTSPTGLLSWGDTLWAITPQNLIGYTWDGAWAGNRRVPWGLTSLRRDGRRLVGTWTGGSGGEGAAVIMTLAGRVLETFGPRCDAAHTGEIAGFAVCLGWNILPRRDGGYVLVNHFQGDALFFPELGGAKRKHLGIGAGKMLSKSSYQSVINDVCCDPAGGYWVLTYKVDGPARICRFDASWKLLGERAVDPEIGQGAIRVLPDGTLCLVEEKASRLDVFDRPSL